MDAWCFLICDTVLYDARFYDVLGVFAFGTENSEYCPIL
jgi:hypothetical protein